jgi:hypothetical protein
MATRSYIAIKQEDQSYLGIYCHSDGYPEGVGATLAKHYKTRDKINHLIEMGYASYIEDTVENSRFYHSWRNEPLTIDSFDLYEDIKNQARCLTCEWLYVFEDGLWTTQSI